MGDGETQDIHGMETVVGNEPRPAATDPAAPVPSDAFHISETVMRGSTTEAPKAFPGPPVQGWDRYDFVGFLGEGGMGRVYKAFDTALKRHVALKFIRGDDPDLAQRLLQEAQTQARVQHEHIGKIYEVGEVQGRRYIAMQFIAGRTLREAFREMTLDEKVRVMKQVAEGLHAAHRLGLVHRDMKPGNVMVERKDDGAWHPFVLDFGLARDVQLRGQTVTGEIIGTPMYMAPEQASGHVHALDRRTDVYSLGASMYELLSGVTPFAGKTAVEVLVKVVGEEPRPLRQIDQRVPADLERIVMKCLEKEPQRRYESARALADDLQRYLDGEPVHARPAGLAYRLAKRARKNRALVGVMLAAFVLVAMAVGMAIRTQWRAREQAIVAQRIGQRVKEIEAIMRFAHLSPLHDTRPERAMVRARMAEIEREIGDVGSVGLGPGNYALGLGHIALHEYDAARERLLTAWDSGYREDEVAVALGLTLGTLYGSKLEEVEKIPDGDARAVARRALEMEYRDPALSYLRQARGTGTDSPEHVECLVALLEKRYDEALAKAKASRERAVWLYESDLLAGEVHQARGTDLADSGQYEAAEGEYAAAQAAYEQAVRTGQSDVDGYVRLCGLWTTVMNMRFKQTGGDLRPLLDSVLATSALALQADPENAGAFTKIAEAHRFWAESEMNQGRVAPEPFEAAIAAARRATELDPTDEEAYDVLGTTFMLRGVVEKETGTDPHATHDEAIRALMRSIEVNPNYIPAYTILGIVYLDRADYENLHGFDARASLDEGIRIYQRAIALSPRFVAALHNIAILYINLAAYQSAHGTDPSLSLDEATRSLDRVLEINPNHGTAYSTRGTAEIVRASHELSTGRNPSEALERATSLAQKNLVLRPDSYSAEINLLAIARIRAEYDQVRGGDPTDALAAAVAIYPKLVERGEMSAFLNMAGTELAMARSILARKRPPTRWLAEAEAVLARARTFNPSSSDAHRMLAESHLLRGRWLIATGRSAARELEEARRFSERSIELNPADALVFACMADVARGLAERGLRDRRAVAEIVDKGLAMVEKALAINPRLASAMATRGELQLLLAMTAPTGPERIAAAQAALQSLGDAVATNAYLEPEVAPSIQRARGLASP